MNTVPTITIEVSDEKGYTIARDRVEFTDPGVSAYDAYYTLNNALYNLNNGTHESQLEDTGMNEELSALDLDSISTKQLLAHIDIRRATPTEDLLDELDRRMNATGVPAEEVDPNEGLVSMTLVLSNDTWDTFVVNAEVAKEVSDRVMCRDAFDFTDANGETFAFVDNEVVRTEVNPNDSVVYVSDEVPNPFSDEFEVVELHLTLKNTEPGEQFPTFEVYRGDADRVFAQLESDDAIIFKDVDDQCHGYLAGTVLSARTDVVSDAPDEALLAEGTVKVTLEVADDVPAEEVVIIQDAIDEVMDGVGFSPMASYTAEAGFDGENLCGTPGCLKCEVLRSDEFEVVESTLVAVTFLCFNKQIITYTDVSPEQGEVAREQVNEGLAVDIHDDDDVVINFVAGSVMGIEIDPTNSFPNDTFGPNAE